jgi:LTXXQ motif family protein
MQNRSSWSRAAVLLVGLTLLASLAEAQRRGGRMPGGLSFGNLCGSAETIGNGLSAIELIVKPTPEQQTALDELKAVAKLNTEAMKPACASGYPATLLDRAAASERRLEATLAGIRRLAPALNKFYGTLNEQQKSEVGTLLILPGV